MIANELLVLQDFWTVVDGWLELGESEEKAIKDLKEMGEKRTTSQNKRLNQLLQLKYLKDRAVRAQERAKSVVSEAENRVSKVTLLNGPMLNSNVIEI